jgi:predicted 3-demethylubiquinone-9 3-methyltransferase (glyoxalase superfamily)
MSRIIPSLWYAEKADEAAAFYASLFPNSSVNNLTALQADSPSGPAGSVKVVEFTLLGQPFMAMSAGPFDRAMRLAQGSLRRILADRAEGAGSYDERPGSGQSRTRRQGDDEDGQARCG